jgi:hypothetical protein
MKFVFHRQIFRKIFIDKISRKSPQWEPSCPMRTEGWTDMTKPIAAFRNFENASKNETRFNSKVLATIKRFTLWSSLFCSIVNLKLNLIVILAVLLHRDETTSVILKKRTSIDTARFDFLTAVLTKIQYFGILRCIEWQLVTYISEERSSSVLVVKQPKKEAWTRRHWRRRFHIFLKMEKKFTSRHAITSRRLVC